MLSNHPAARFVHASSVVAPSKPADLIANAVAKSEAEQTAKANTVQAKALKTNEAVVSAALTNANTDHDKSVLSRQLSDQETAAKAASQKSDAKLGAAIVGGGLGLLWLFFL